MNIKETKYNLIYKTTNLINNKIYVGVHCTDDIDDTYLGSGKLIIKAIKKYGKENFKREILYEFGSAELAFWYESYLVDHDFINREDTYNVAIGGGLPFTGRKHSEESKEQMSNSRKGLVPWNKGKHHTKETKEKISSYRHTEEQKLKMSNALKGREFSEKHCNAISNSLKGHKVSLETREKIKESNKGHIPWNKGLKLEPMNTVSDTNFNQDFELIDDSRYATFSTSKVNLIRYKS